MKHKDYFLSLLTCLWCFTQLTAQQAINTSKKRQIGIQIGYDKTYLKDLNYSKLNFEGNGYVIDLNYLKQTKKENLFYGGFSFTSTTISNSASSFLDASNYQTNLTLGWLKKVTTPNDKIKLYIGGQYHTYLNMVFYDGTEAITFYGVHGLDLSGKIAYRVNSKHKLSSTLSIPILNILVRPPHTGWNTFVVDSSPLLVVFKGKASSLHNNIGMNWNTEYMYKMSEKWDLTAQYRFRYYTTKQLHKAIVVNNQLSLGVNRKF